jgi:hypothetical protein
VSDARIEEKRKSYRMVILSLSIKGVTQVLLLPEAIDVFIEDVVNILTKEQRF